MVLTSISPIPSFKSWTSSSWGRHVPSYVHILVSLAKRGDFLNESQKHRGDVWECSVKRPHLASRCHFAFYLSVFTCLESGNTRWGSGGHSVIERASPHTCQKLWPSHPWAREAKPAAADLWTSCDIGETTLQCLSRCSSQVSACCIAKILIYVDKENRCVAQLTDTTIASEGYVSDGEGYLRLKPLNPSDRVANPDLGKFLSLWLVPSPAKQE